MSRASPSAGALLRKSARLTCARETHEAPDGARRTALGYLPEVFVCLLVSYIDWRHRSVEPNSSSHRGNEFATPSHRCVAASLRALRTAAQRCFRTDSLVQHTNRCALGMGLNAASLAPSTGQ